MQILRRLILEAHRRSLWQVLGVYLLGAWFAYEVILALADGIGLPDWVPAFAIVLIVIGLPVVLATAFVQEGVGRTEPADPTLLPGLMPDAPQPALAAARSTLTWRRALGAGLVAFIALGASAFGYIGMRAGGIGPFGSLVAAGVIERKAPVLIADFETNGADEGLAAAVTDALRVDFAQSEVVTVYDATELRAALLRMRRDPGAPLDPTTAQELAEREGVPIVLVGEINSAGAGYFLTARLISVRDGATLVAARESATNADGVIPAVDALSRSIRERIGESLRLLRNAEPLAQVTTASLPALRKYSQGYRAGFLQGDYELAETLLRDAIAVDSAFASAWRLLAVVYNNADGSSTNQIRAATRAYELRDRLTERERLIATAYYHSNVLYDNQAAIAAYRTLLDTHPTDRIALNNIALVYARLGRHDEAEAALRTAVASDPTSATAFLNLGYSLIQAGDLEAAQEVHDSFARALPGHSTLVATRLALLYARGEIDSLAVVADSTIEVALPFVRNRALRIRTALAARAGAVADARQWSMRTIQDAQERSAATVVLNARDALAFFTAVVLQRPEEAADSVRTIISSPQWREVPAADRPYLRIAETAAAAGDVATARAMLADFERDVLPLQPGRAWESAAANGWIALQEDRAGDAIAHFGRAAEDGECGVCGVYELAIAHELTGDVAAAIAALERYLAATSPLRLELDAFFLVAAHERLGNLYEQHGDAEAAIRHYVAVTELWANADAELQPRVEAARVAITRLRAS